MRMEPDRRSEFQGFLRPEDRCAKFANMVCDDTSGAVLYMAFLAEARAADFPNAQEDSFVVHSIGIHNLACYYKTDTHTQARTSTDRFDFALWERAATDSCPSPKFSRLKCSMPP